MLDPTTVGCGYAYDLEWIIHPPPPTGTDTRRADLAAQTAALQGRMSARREAPR